MAMKTEPVQSRLVSWHRRAFLHFICLALVIFAVYQHVLPRYQFHRSTVPKQPKVGEYSWWRCRGPTGLWYDCGTIVVPKDYFDPDAGTATIALARYRATKRPWKGVIWYNPGGPGGSGVDFLAIGGQALAKLLGEDWDIIGFDPRGVGLTKPTVRCFPDRMAEDLFVANTVLEQGITVSSIANLSSQSLREELVNQYRQFLSLKESQALLCAKTMGKELKYMGTATVVRDMDFMNKVLEGEDTPINYYGASYGSIPGAYLVNMMPNRTKYVMIDAIVDPVSWSNEPSHLWPLNWLASTEETYEIFLKSCAKAGPASCALSHADNEDWRDLERRFEQFFDQLAAAPLPVPFGLRPGYLTSGAARGMLMFLLDNPMGWQVGAEEFADAMRGNGTALFNKFTRDYVTDALPVSYSRDLSRLAVACLDSPPPSSPAEYPTAEELADVALKTLRERSVHFGVSLGISEPDGGCQYWPARSPERFTGPFNASLDTPLLILSSTADPITPLSSARRVNSLMPHSSILVLQNSPGHGTASVPSLCTVKIARNYFGGILPTNGTVCEVDVDLFPTAEAQEQADAQLAAMSADDRELYDATVQFGKYMELVRSNVS